MADHVLEPAAQALADATANPPYFAQMTPTEARKVLDDVQTQPTPKLDVDETWVTVPADVGGVPVRIVKPAGTPDATLLPTVLYVHGGGWVLGNAAVDAAVSRTGFSIMKSIEFAVHTLRNAFEATAATAAPAAA